MLPAGNAITLTPPAHRLTAGLALSVALHALIVLAVTLSPPRLVAPVPLQVELRPVEAQQLNAEVASEQPSELTATASVAAVPELPPAADDAPPPAAAPEAPVAISLPLEKYFTARELDVRAEPINEVDLVYPVKAYEMRMPGRVVVRILINEHGAVDGASVVEAAPPGVFEEAALAATQALLFRPAQKHGRGVKSQKTIEVTFDPYESIRQR